VAARVEPILTIADLDAMPEDENGSDALSVGSACQGDQILMILLNGRGGGARLLKGRGRAPIFFSTTNGKSPRRLTAPRSCNVCSHFGTGAVGRLWFGLGLRNDSASLSEQMTRQITHVGVGGDMFDFDSLLVYKRSSFPQTARCGISVSVNSRWDSGATS
jgi:hypothetical protein